MQDAHQKSIQVSPSCQIPNLMHFYSKYFGNKIGTFVEVGAFDGESFSNTSVLADLGWKGFYIEPVHEFAVRCQLRHKNNQNISVSNIAISDQIEIIEIAVGGVLSTASSDTREAYKNIDWAKNLPFDTKKREVQSYPLDYFLKEKNILDPFELLVIDVEGHEEKVFNGFSLSQWLPKMIIVELNDYHPSFNSFPLLQASSARVRNLILNSGYMQAYCDEINSIFVLPN